MVINGVTVPLPVGAISPRISPIAPVVAYKSIYGPIIVIKQDGSSQVVYQTSVGNYPVAWGPNGFLYTQTDGSGSLKIWSDGRFIGQVEADYAAEGIHSVDPSGSIRMGNANNHMVKSGVDLWKFQIDGERIVGFGDGGSSRGSVNYWDGFSMKMWISNQDLQFPVYTSGGKIAITGHDTPSPSEVVLVPYKQYSAPVVEPPVVVPELPPAPPPPIIVVTPPVPVPEPPKAPVEPKQPSRWERIWKIAAPYVPLILKRFSR